MPPIPQTFDIDSLHRRQNDLTDFQIPRLRDCTGPLSVQQRLAAELREDLDVFVKQVENLEIHAEDLPRKSDRLAVTQLVEAFRESSVKIRKEMRAALLHSKKTIDAQAKSNREELFGAVPQDSRNVEEKATDDALMKASNDITTSLHRTLSLMQSELSRSVLSHQLLSQSSQTLHATSSQHDILTSTTHASHQLITALEKADWLDRLLICAALACFALTVLFVLKQRVVDRGLRLAFWWTRFLPGAGGGVEKAKEKMGEALSLAMQEEGRVSPTVSAITASVSTLAQRITQSAKDALSSELPSTFSETSSSLSSSLSSITESLIDATTSSTLPESAATTILSTTTTTTTLDTLLMTQLSSVRHPEL